MDDLLTWTTLEIFGLCLAAAALIGFAIVGIACILHDHEGQLEEAGPYLIELGKHQATEGELGKALGYDFTDKHKGDSNDE